MSVRTSPEMTRNRSSSSSRALQHRAGRAERRLLGGVDHADAELGAVAEVGADGVGHEGDGDDDVGHPVLAQQADDVLHHRPVGHRQHRLRLVRRERPQPRPLAARHDHCLHAPTSPPRSAPLVLCRLVLCRAAPPGPRPGPGGPGRGRRPRPPRPAPGRYPRSPTRSRGTVPASWPCRGSTRTRGRRTSGRTSRPCRSTGRRSASRRARPGRSTVPATTTSRASVATPNQIGTAPWIMMAITPVPTRTRSAAGSSTLPTVETWWNRRARNPSTQSVAPSTPSRMAAAVWRWAPNSSHRNSGRQSRRTTVTALGTVRTRSRPGSSGTA